MKRIGLVIAAIVVLVLAIGLGGFVLGAPVTTEELLFRYVSNEDVNNFSAKATVNISVSAMSVRATVPVTANMRVANNMAHGTIDVGLSELDTRDYTMEVYAELNDDSLVCYIGTPNGDSTAWKCWKVNMTSTVDISTITELLSVSELTLIAKDSDPKVSYELAVPTAKVLQTVFDVTEGTAEVAGMDEQGMIDSVGKDKVRVDFTKDCLMRSLSTDVLVNLKSAETNDIAVRIGLDIDAVLDDYGEIDPSSVTVPDDVRNAAVPTSEPVDIIEVIGTDSPLAGAVKH